MSNNPLSNYFRHPELYIPLPSNGKWWPNDALVMPENKELAICPMTGQDELLMKNADGLMNGDTTTKVMQSCCQSIKNAWEAPSIDIDTLMISIRIASYGHKLDAETTCSKCKEHIDYAVDLRSILANIQVPNYDAPFEVKGLTIFTRPAPYKIVNLNNIETYQQQRTILQLKDQNITEEEKIEIIKAAVKRLTDISISRLNEFIDKIVLPDGTIITDKKFITEFITNADRETFTKIKDEIANKASEYKLPMIPITCESCGNREERVFQFDPASFFATSS